MRTLVGAIAICVMVGAFGCADRAGTTFTDAPLVKHVPAALSVNGDSATSAWALFDRSTTSAWSPGGQVELSLELAGSPSIAAVKIYGAPEVRIAHIATGTGTTLASDIELSHLAEGWNTLVLDRLVEASTIHITIEPKIAGAAIGEIELWGEGSAPRAPIDTLLATDDTSYVDRVLAPGTDRVLSESEPCADFTAALPRHLSTYAAVYLAVSTQNVFRPFVIARRINGSERTGGAWITPFRGAARFVERIDPSELLAGENRITYCRPAEASSAVTIEQVELVGVLDRGWQMAHAVFVGGDEAAAVLDGEPTSARSVPAGTPIDVELARRLAPSSIHLAGVVTEPAAVTCRSATGETQKLATRATAAPAGAEIHVEGDGASCAHLELVFDTDVEIAELDVVGSGTREAIDVPRLVVTSAREHFGDRAWVAGYVERPPQMTGPVRVAVDKIDQDSTSGRYSALLSRAESVDDVWVVPVTATLPGGSEATEQVLLDRSARRELSDAQTTPQEPSDSPSSDDRWGLEGDSVSKTLLPEKVDQRVSLGTKVGVFVPAGAIGAKTTITIRHLGTAQLPPLDPGMINVTAPGRRGYEFLPHGQRFLRPVSVTLPYDPALIPKGMTPADVHTFFFDTVAQRWVALSRESVDAGEQVVTSQTDHFTIMINAVLTVPDHPTPLSFDPTSLSSIAAASPAAGIDLVAPPAADSSGDAKLSLPLRAPAGRGAFSPSLSATYASSRDNGWLGMGWDLALSRIEIDTRWGVPTYGRDGEGNILLPPEDDPEVRYLLDGAPLVPTDETEGPSCRFGGTSRRYRARVEGAFSHILRCGNGPDRVHFEIRDRAGTLFVYGDHSSSAGGNQAASSSLKSPEHGGVFSWHLRRVEDRHGNVTRFFYRIDDQVPDQGERSRQIYPEAIEYTSRSSDASAPYRIELVLDDGSRPDVITTGRPGFKVATRHLLRSVQMKFQSQIVRQYVFTYRHGQFQKSLLAAITQFGAGGCAASGNAFSAPVCPGAARFVEHRFDYLAEERAFSEPIAWTVAGDPAPEQAALGKGFTRSSSFRGHIGVNVGGAVTVGGRASLGSGSRDELLGLYDVNGDGLPDQIVDREDSPPLVLYNQSSPGLSPGAGPLLATGGPAVSGIDELGHEKSSQFSGGLYLQIGDPNAIAASAGGGFANSTSRADRLLTDLNGDGFLDQVSADGQARYGSPCEEGFCLVPGLFGAAGALDPKDDPVLAANDAEISERLFLAAPVIQWTAPFSGRVVVSGGAQKVRAGGADGVFVELFANDQLIDSAFFAPEATTPIAFPSHERTIDVTRGDAIYLRVLTGQDPGIDSDGQLLDQVDAEFTVSYKRVCDTFPCRQIADPLAAKDPTGRPIYAFSSRTDFSLAGTPVPVTASADGTLAISGTLKKRPSAANLRACLQTFPHDAETFDVPCAEVSTLGPFSFAAGSSTELALSELVAVAAGDRLLLRVESELSFDPADLVFSPPVSGAPSLSYQQVCLPNDDATAIECTSDPQVLETVPLPSAYFGAFAALVDPAPEQPREPLVVPDSGDLSVPSPPALNEPFLFAIRSDRQGVLFLADCRFQSCQPLSVGPLPVTQGESVTFELLTESGATGMAQLSVSLGSQVISAPLVSRPFVADSAPPTPFFGGHRGFRYGLWNSQVPFAPTELLADFADLESLSADRLFAIGRSMSAPLPLFFGAETTAGAPAWAGAASTAFVSATSLFAARVGDTGLSADGTPNPKESGLFGSGYLRVSGTRSFYFEAGVVIKNVKDIIDLDLSLGLTFSSTATTTDLIDMNGDGIADAVGPTQTILGIPTAALGPLGSLLSSPEGFRLRKGLDYSIGFGGRAVFEQKTSSGRTLSTGNEKGPDRGTLGLGSGAGLALGRSQTTQDLIDVNGDGLPDRIRREGPKVWVSLNLGHRFGAEELFGLVHEDLQEKVDSFASLESTLFGVEQKDALQHDTTLSRHLSSGFSLLGVLDISTSNKATVSRTTIQLADINGDGLPDFLYKKHRDPRLRVQLNLGSSLQDTNTPWNAGEWAIGGSPIELPSLVDHRIVELGLTGPDVLAATGRQSGSDISVSVNLGFAGVGGSRSKQTDSYDLALVDIDGDGVADHVLRRKKSGETGKIYVKHNRVTGRANLLSRIERPLGGAITLDYQRTANTVDLPRSRQVLSKVVVSDGVDLGSTFESPDLVTTFAYEGGFYSRSEKEFFGFSKVTSKRADGVRTVDTYENRTYALRGQLRQSRRIDPSGVVRDSNEREFFVRPVFGESGAPVTADPRCVEALHPLLPQTACTPVHPVVTSETMTRSEDGVTKKSRIRQDLDFDRFGNILTATDSGDDAIDTDDLHIVATYQNDTSEWILGLPTSLVVRERDAAGEILRRRLGTYDEHGDLVALSVDTGTELATSRFDYDSNGNLSRVTTPPNQAGQVQTVDIAYDSITGTYPVSVTDGFGLQSTATYDLRFGEVTEATDTNGQKTVRAYDAFGRLVSVRGPYDGAEPTLSFEYRHTESPPLAVTKNRSSPPLGYGGPVPPVVTTVIAADGLGRPIQQRMTAVVGGVAGMTTAGMSRFDIVGRAVASFQPFFDAGASEAFALPQQVPLSTLTDYDALDRVTQTTFPDGAQVTSAFSIAASPAGDLLFSTQTLDENNNPREAFADVAGNTRAFVEHPSASADSVTTYDYLGTGELSSITDAEGNITALTYDRRGLLVSMKNADTGFIEQRYDLLGNRTELIEPNHRAVGASVRFSYDRDRLVGIDYPSKPDVTFVYGAAGAPFGRAGRVAEVRDESGRIESFYGALGETVRTRRVVDAHPAGPPGPPPVVFDTRLVTDSLGRLLEIAYPDGEVVTHAFDAAANLVAVTGRGKGWQRTYASELAYDVFGNRISMTFGNGAKTTWSFAPERVRLAAMTTTLPGNNPVQDLRYHYDPAGNPTTIDSVLATPAPGSNLPGSAHWAFTYDGVDRLVTASGNADITPQKTTEYTQFFSYSPSHNLLSKKRIHIVNQPSQTATFPPSTNVDLAYSYGSRPHAPTQVGGLQIAYDASGNPVERKKTGTGAVQHLIWDDDGRLIEVGGPGGFQRNVYDAAGTRVIRRSAQGTTIFASPFYDLKDGIQGTKHIFAGSTRIASVLARFDGPAIAPGQANGNGQGQGQGQGQGNNQGNGQGSGDPNAAPLPPKKPGTAYFFHLDHLGSTSVLSNQDGNVHQHLQYFPDGEVWIESGPNNPINGYLFSGKPIDPTTGFYDFGQRFYDPKTSLWLGVDPKLAQQPEAAVADPVGLSPYAYTGHNPIGFIDPDGRDRYALKVMRRRRGNALQRFSGRIGRRFAAQHKPALVVEATIAIAIGGFVAPLLAPAAGAGAAKATTALGAVRPEYFLALSLATAKNEEEAAKAATGELGGLLLLGLLSRVFRAPPGTGGGGGGGLGARGIAGGCFVAGTMVATPSGPVPIQQLQVGALVLARDEKTGELRYDRVTRTFVRHNAPIVEVVVREPGGNIETLETTAEHPFWIEGRGWVEASGLEPGSSVRLKGGRTANLAALTSTERLATVYNIEVGGAHTYFVGEFGTWVHNKPLDVVAKAKRIAARISRKLKCKGQCDGFAARLQKRLEANGLQGQHIRIEAGPGTVIYSDSKGVLSARTTRSGPGYHEAIQVGDTVFDNLRSGGMAADDFFKDIGADWIQKTGGSINKTQF